MFYASMPDMQTNYRGIFYIIFSGLCFSLMMLFVKLAGPLPSMQKALFRNLIALAVSLFILFRTREQLTFKKKDTGLLLLRALAGTVGLISNFYATDNLILSDATILNKLAPFFAIILSMIFLKEKINLTQALLVLGAFFGASLVVQPSFSNRDLFPYLVGILGGLASGAAYTCVRQLGNRQVAPAIIVAFFSFFSTLAITPFVIATYQSMNLKQIIILICAGSFAAGGQFTLTKAYSYAPAKELSVYDYSQVLFASVLSIFVLSEYPDALSVTGYVVIIAMAALMFLYNKRKA